MKHLQRFAKLLAKSSHHSPSEAVSSLFPTYSYPFPLQGLLKRFTGPIQQVDGGCQFNQQAQAFRSSSPCVHSVPLSAAEAFTTRNADPHISPWRPTSNILVARGAHSGPGAPGQQPPDRKRQSQDWAQAGWTWSEVCNLPNSLSLARLASGPFISALIINHNWSTAFVAISVAAITDWLDGAVAKRWHTNSVLGSYLDPLADKVLVCCVGGALGYEGSLPVWLASLIIGRDVLLVGGTVYARFSSLDFKWPGWAEFFSVAAGIPESKPPSQQSHLPGSTSSTHTHPPGRGVSSEAMPDALSTASAAQRPFQPHSNNQQAQSSACDTDAANASAQACSPAAGASGHDPAPSAPLIKPLFISKLNTCVQLALVAGCLSRSWYEWPSDDMVFLLGATTALTTLGSGAAYLVAFRRGSGTFTAMPSIGPHKH